MGRSNPQEDFNADDARRRDAGRRGRPPARGFRSRSRRSTPHRENAGERLGGCRGELPGRAVGSLRYGRAQFRRPRETPVSAPAGAPHTSSRLLGGRVRRKGGDEIHARLRRRAFISFQGIPASGLDRASRSLASRRSLSSGDRVKSAEGDARSQSVCARSSCSSRGSSSACLVRSDLVISLV